MFGFDACVAYERYFLEVFFHHPLEVVAEVSVGEEDVEVALVVGEENVAVIFVDVLASFNFDFDEEEPKSTLGPELGHVVGDDIGVSKEAGDDDAGGYNDGDDDEEGKGDEKGVNFVEDVYCFYCCWCLNVWVYGLMGGDGVENPERPNGAAGGGARGEGERVNGGKVLEGRKVGVGVGG